MPAATPQFGDFPKPLAGEPYGYLFKGKLQGCTREELIHRCASRNFRQVQLVWTPETRELVPVTEVPFLFAASLAALRFRTRMSLLITLAIAAVLAVSAKQAWHEQRSYSLLILVALVLVGIVPSIRSLRTLRELAGIEVPTWPGITTEHSISAPRVLRVKSSTAAIRAVCPGAFLCAQHHSRRKLVPLLTMLTMRARSPRRDKPPSNVVGFAERLQLEHGTQGGL